MRTSPLCLGLAMLFGMAVLVGSAAPYVAADEGGGVFGIFFGSKSKEKPKEVQKEEAAEIPDDDPRAIATHEQTAIIKVTGVQDSDENTDDAGDARAVHTNLSGKVRLHTFCLNASGNILAGVGEKPGEVRMFDPDGKYLAAWNVPIKPEAIGVGEDGSVYVGGSGQVIKLDGDGNVVLEADAPHIVALRENEEKIREQVVQQLKQQREMFSKQIEAYEKRIADLEEKDEENRTKQDERRLQAYRRNLDSMKEFAGGSAKEITDEQIDQAVEANFARKQRVSSISAAGGDVFLACYGAVGYGFDVWRLDERLENAEQVVTGLRGCCGQMDVQAGPNGVYVAENSRDRVCRYDREGEMLTHWGKSARKGLVGFGSCCNPMNVAFGPNGDVYTAESSLGRIKRYSPDGELLGLVGTVKLVPGCKNVAIAVSEDGERVYMMDITRTHIVLMTKTTATPESTEEEPAAPDKPVAETAAASGATPGGS